MKETVIVLDVDGKHGKILARKIRGLHVYAKILPHSTPVDKLLEAAPIGIILAGDCENEILSDYNIDERIFESQIPILCVGGGSRLLIEAFANATTNTDSANKYVKIDKPSILFAGVDAGLINLDNLCSIDKLPLGFDPIGFSDNCIIAFENKNKRLFSIQFNISCGQCEKILGNFLFGVCGASGNWTVENFIDESVSSIRERVGEGRVLLALSGGVDSAVCAVLLDKSIGHRLNCIFVDHGLLRTNEAQQVAEVFSGAYNINLICINAQQRFLNRLAKVTDPEQKRKIIGETFIRIFEEESAKLGEIEFLAQGTIYSDVMESGNGTSVIKSHHNVGGLPNKLNFREIIEPLRDLFKDEVRALGQALGMPRHMVWRQPFPGPGLAIRIIGEVTGEKIKILQAADQIFCQEIERLDLHIWQYFALLTDMRSVGVLNNKRTYDYTVALRAITSTDGTAADWAFLPHKVLNRISMRITSEVKGVNRVVYDITSKPPATIEWE